MRIERAGLRSAMGLLEATILFGLGMFGLGTGAAAAAESSLPVNWQMGMPEMVTAVGQSMSSFHTQLVWLIVAISLFVLVLLVIVIVRFNEKANAAPTRTTHNTAIEVLWTVVPVLILVVIAIPSFRILRHELVIPEPEIVVKAIGNAWYWTYEYPADQGGFRFDSYMVDAKDLKPGQPRLLTVDNDVVLPVNKIVKLQVTASDVIHAFAMPPFGVKVDAVPGRLNELWFKAEREGVYHGQCSELCGARHAFMPITIRIVSDDEYRAWLAEAKQKFARIDGDMTVAAARR